MFIVAAAVTILLVLMMWQFLYPLLWEYAVDEQGVSVRVLSRFVPVRISYDQIDKVERVDWSHALRINFGGLVGRRQWNWSNRLFGERLVIYRKDGTIVLLTPQDPDRFLFDLETQRRK